MHLATVWHVIDECLREQKWFLITFCCAEFKVHSNYYYLPLTLTVNMDL